MGLAVVKLMQIQIVTVQIYLFLRELSDKLICG